MSVRTQVFISYAHTDARWLTRLQVHLKPLADRGLVEVWDDTKLRASQRWRTEIEGALSRAKIAILLVSPDFLASDFVMRQEVPALIAAAGSTGAEILPVIVSSCLFEQHPVLSAIQAANDPKAPLDGMPKARRERVLSNVARRVSELVSTADQQAATATAPSGNAVNAPAHAAPPSSARGSSPVAAQGSRGPAEPTVADLVSRDAVLALAAAELLPPDDPSLIVQALAQQDQHSHEILPIVMRRYFRRAPAVNAPFLVERLAGDTFSWRSAVRIPANFTPAHPSSCADTLIEVFKKRGDPDRVRLATEALGFLGAEGWSFTLVEELQRLDRIGDSYMYDKIESYVVLAAARIFSLYEASVWSESRVSELIETLAAAIRLASDHGWRSILQGLLLDQLAHCRPRHADALLRRWLASDNSELQRFAAHALGQMRLARARDPLLALGQRTSADAKARVAAVLALGHIGGEQTFDELVRLHALGDPVIGGALEYAIARSLYEVTDRDKLASMATLLLASPTLSETSYVYRALGLSGDARHVDAVRAGLHHAERSARGHAALALARLTHGTYRRDLLRAAEEAGTVFERILCALALMVAEREPAANVQRVSALRELLPQDSFLYARWTRDDIDTVLTEHGGESGNEVAAAWRTIYSECVNY